MADPEDDAAAWRELRREAHVPDEPVRPKPRPVPNPKRLVAAGVSKELTWNPGEAPLPQQGPRLRYPWETDSCRPGDPEVMAHAQKGRAPALPGFRLGGAVLEGDGERWVVTQTASNWWSAAAWLAYPLGPEWGEDPLLAIEAFQQAWRVEWRRISGLS